MKVLLLALAIGAAQAAEVRVLCSNGMKSVVDEVRAGWEKTSGHKLSVEFSSANQLRQTIGAGAAFDAAIIGSDVASDLMKEGKLGVATGTIARGGVGIGIRKGAPKPDLKGDGLKRFLLGAKSIVYTGNGASRPTIERMFDKLGIASAMKAKVQLAGPGEAPERVAHGQAEVVLTLVSEILPIEGVELLAPLPAEHQNYISFVGALSIKPAQASAARQFLDYLSSPAIVAVLKNKGLER